MSITMISLVSEQMAPIVLGALHFKPERMIYVRSEFPIFVENIKKINVYLKQRFSFKHEEVVVNPFDLEDNINRLTDIVQRPNNYVCNITGGTKLMAIAAFQVMKERGIPSIYVDTANVRLIHFGVTGESIKQSSLLRLNVSNFVSLVGGEIKQQQTSFFKQESRLRGLVDLILPDPLRWSEFNRFLHLAVEQSQSETLEYDVPFTLIERQKRKKRKYNPDLFGQLRIEGFFKQVRESCGRVSFSFADKMAKVILLNNGLWLEYLVYDLLRDIGDHDDLQAGVKFAWEKKENGSRHNPSNELDVMCTRASKLFCISCKAGSNLKDVPKYLNEIDQYARKLGGVYYQSALVVTHPLNPEYKKRAEQMKVQIFTLDGNLEDIRNQFVAWLR